MLNSGTTVMLCLFIIYNEAIMQKRNPQDEHPSNSTSREGMISMRKGDLVTLAIQAKNRAKTLNHPLDAFVELAEAVEQYYKKVIAEETEKHLAAYQDWAERRDQLAFENVSLVGENLKMTSALADPEAVLINMMRGVIAVPSIRSLSKLWGEVINDEDKQLLEIARLREALACTTAELAEIKKQQAQLPHDSQ